MLRREFIKTSAQASIALSASLFSLAAKAANYNVIVVGGGMAGATVAKYLRLWSKNQISVALIEKDASYVSNIMSNEVITGKRASVSSLTYSYSALSSKVQRFTGAFLMTRARTTYDRLTRKRGIQSSQRATENRIGGAILTLRVQELSVLITHGIVNA